MTLNELKTIAKAKVATLSDADMIAYVEATDQYLIADELCTRCDIQNSMANVDVFEIALDARAIVEFGM